MSGESTEIALAGARTAVLSRLWGALAREPFDVVTDRRTVSGDLVVRTQNGEWRGPVAASMPFARPEPTLAVTGRANPGAGSATVTDPGALVAAVFGDGEAASRLRAEIDNSVANLAMARAAQPGAHGGPPELVALVNDPDSLACFEQSVVDGHPLHPLCRTRMGMSPEEDRTYGPEFRPTLDLTVFEVPERAWMSSGTGLPPKLPVHPWQRDHVLDEHPSLKPTGEAIPVKPLMSLRTVARLDDRRWHLKTAVDVQMTSAVRTVSPAAIHNGPVMSALLRQMCRDEPIEVLDEVAAGAVLIDGEPSRSLAVVHRRAPRLQQDEIALPFAVLSVPSPASGRSYAIEAVAMHGGDPEAFFCDVAALMLPALLRLLHRGAALEAHGQNTLLVLKNGRPSRLCYRDMGGVRVSGRRLADAGVKSPVLLGDIATDDADELRTKLAAAAISTVMAELIATLSRESGADPTRLWRHVAHTVRATYEQLPSAAAGDAAAILGPTLPIKATTAMRLAARPLEDIWAPIPNPMAEL